MVPGNICIGAGHAFLHVSWRQVSFPILGCGGWCFNVRSVALDAFINSKGHGC